MRVRVRVCVCVCLHEPSKQSKEQHETTEIGARGRNGQQSCNGDLQDGALLLSGMSEQHHTNRHVLTQPALEKQVNAQSEAVACWFLSFERACVVCCVCCVCAGVCCVVGRLSGGLGVVMHMVCAVR